MDGTCCALALGEIRDRQAVPVLRTILDRKLDFYPALALGQIGDPAALPSLEAYKEYFEINTRARAEEAADRIRK